MSFICLDDLLDQFVTNNIPVGKIDKPDSFDAVNDFLHFNETGILAARKIDLRDIAGHHGPRVKSQPSEKHLHLFSGCVLGLIKNNERIVKGTGRA